MGATLASESRSDAAGSPSEAGLFVHFRRFVSCGFAPVGAGRLGARGSLAVECLFAIDAIAAVYRAEPRPFDGMGFVIAIGDNSSDGVHLAVPLVAHSAGVRSHLAAHAGAARPRIPGCGSL